MVRPSRHEDVEDSGLAEDDHRQEDPPPLIQEIAPGPEHGDQRQQQQK